MNKTNIGLCLALVAGACLITGCATSGTTTVPPNGPVIINDKNLDIQDFALKGEEMVTSLVESSVLDKSAQHPAVVAIGRIVNNTGQFIDTDLLMKKIRVNLSKNGKAVTDTTGGVLNTVDFTFSGKIIQPPNAIEGRKTQRSYVFQLSLTDNKGLAVWEEEKIVTKITKRGGVDL